MRRETLTMPHAGGRTKQRRAPARRAPCGVLFRRFRAGMVGRADRFGGRAARQLCAVPVRSAKFRPRRADRAQVIGRLASERRSA